MQTGDDAPLSEGHRPGNAWIRTVAGAEAPKWATLQTERTVLVVVRTLTTLTWLFDILPELLQDVRVQVVFTVNGDSSAYEPGVPEFVREIGGCLLPWEQATDHTFDLAISASHYGGLHELRSPLLILPHGPGFSKTISLPSRGQPFVAPEPGARASVTVALTHEEQRLQWQQSINTGVRAVVVGDPCLDRLRASVGDRDRYRAALGVSKDQKLIVVCSTWGPNALLAQRPDLPARLLRELPQDEYVVGVVLHPNIWIGHGTWQVRLWLGRALESGLRLMPVREGWRGAVVAADGAICDHGSVSLYAAGLGVPLLTGAFGHDELDPSTPLAALGQRLARLPDDGDLRPPIESLVSTARDRSRHQDLLARVFSHDGRALERLQATIYEIMHLEAPPTRPLVLPVPIPRPEGHRATTQLVIAKPADPRPSRVPAVAIERFPAALEPDGESRPGGFLVADETEAQRGLRESAAVILRWERPEPDDLLIDPDQWTASILERYPGCRIAATSDGHRGVLRLRGGPLLCATADTPIDVGLIAAGAYALFVDGALDVALRPGFVIVTGQRVSEVRVTPAVAPRACR